MVQVYFRDNSELFVDMTNKTVTYINKQAEVFTMLSSDAQKSTDAELRKRLSYTKEILSSQKAQSGGG